MSKLPLSPILLTGLVVIFVGGVATYSMQSRNDNNAATENSVVQVTPIATPTITASSAVPVTKPTIKHIGINLDYYDAATNSAGDLKFTKATFASGPAMQLLFTEFGYEIPGNSATGGVAKRNVQPTFIAPLGTKVHSLVDGVVVDVPKLYSNDYSVMVRAEGSNLIFETEHVINVVVKKGDTLKAGQVVAEVSDYDAKNYAGFGLVEIGVLDGGSGGMPSHLCPFSFLDDAIKDDTFKKIDALKKSWETYRGNAAIYDEAKTVIPGCLTTDPIEG
jgi:hypothetical protein